MRTWTATTTVDASPEAVLDVLCDPQACARWAPVGFEARALQGPRLETGSRPRVHGRLGALDVAFDVEVVEAHDGRLTLRAAGPVAMDVAYRLHPAGDGSEIRASVGVRPGRGLRGRLLEEATAGLLRAGALHAALERIGREAAVTCAA